MSVMMAFWIGFAAGMIAVLIIAFGALKLESILHRGDEE